MCLLRTVHSAHLVGSCGNRDEFRRQIQNFGTQVILSRTFDAMGMSDKLFEKREIFVQHSAVVDFVNVAKQNGILEVEALRFLGYREYMHKVANAKDMSGDQAPALITVSNSYTLSHRVINNNLKTIKNGVLYNGTFSLANKVMTEEDAMSQRDFDAVCYIINHALHNGHGLPPYILVIDKAEDIHQKPKQFEKRARLALTRRDKLLIDADDAGKCVGNDYWYIKEKIGKETGKFREETILVPAVVYCEKQLSYYVVENDHGTISHVLFQDWAKNKIGVLNDAQQNIAGEHVQNLDKHKENDLQYTEYLKLMNMYAEVECSDSRRFKSIARGIVKLLGGLPTDQQLMDILSSPDRNQIRFNIHMKCGYINAMIAMNRALMEIEELTANNPELRGQIRRKVNRVLKGEPVNIDFSALFGKLEKEQRKDENGNLVFGPSPATITELQSLLRDSDDDKRSLLRHAMETRVFEYEGYYGLPRMTAAIEINEALSRLGQDPAKIDPAIYEVLIIENVARRLYARVIAFYMEHGKEIDKTRGKKDILFDVVIADIAKAYRWNIPEPEDTLEYLLSPYRVDAITGKIIDVCHLWNGTQHCCTSH